MTKPNSSKLERLAGITFDESSPLNQAYLKERRAEDLSVIGDFDESSNYYTKAIGE